MKIGIIVVWLCLIIYMTIVLKAKKVDRNERKWVYVLVIIAVGCSIAVMLNISFNPVIYLLNHTIGRLSRMVVKI